MRFGDAEQGLGVLNRVWRCAPLAALGGSASLAAWSGLWAPHRVFLGILLRRITEWFVFEGTVKIIFPHPC